MQLIMMYGNPTVGKSTLAKRISDSFGHEILKSVTTRFNGQKILLTADSFDETIKETKQSKDESYKELCILAEQKLKENKKVILDATFHKHYRRQWVYDLCDRLDIIPILIWVKNDDINHNTFTERKSSQDYKDNLLDSIDKYNIMVEQTDKIENYELRQLNSQVSIVQFDRKNDSLSIINDKDNQELAKFCLTLSGNL